MVCSRAIATSVGGARENSHVHFATDSVGRRRARAANMRLLHGSAVAFRLHAVRSMTVALAGRAPATFEIKSATLPLVSLLLKSTDLAALADELKARFGDVPQFFDNDPLVLDLSPLKGEGEVDFAELMHLLRGYRVIPVAVKGGSEGQMQQGVLKGLAVANEARVVHPASATPDRVRGDKPVDKTVVPTSALVVDKPLRSGQQVYA